MNTPAPKEHPPLQGMQLLLLTTGLAMATFMEVLDMTIVNVSVPHIAGSLGVSPTEGTWSISSYALAAAIVQPITGWIGRRFGEVRAFTTSLALFLVFSLLCGLATSMPMLVAARLIQGLVSGPMIGIGQALLLRNFPGHKRAQAMSIWAMVVLVAPICGPILGGWITDNLSWRWLFFINVPVGIISLLLTISILKGRESEIVKTPVDRTGIVLLIIGVGSLQYMLDNGNEKDWFNSTEILVTGIVALISIVYLIVWELNIKYPVLDLHLFKHHNFRIGILCISVGYFALFSNNVMFPLWLQTSMGYTSTWAGLAMAPIGILGLITTPLIGKYMHRAGYRRSAAVSFLVMGICMYWVSTLNQYASFEQIAMPRFVIGSVMSMFFLPLYQIMMSDVNVNGLAAATGMANFMRTMGASLGTAISVWLWNERSDYHHTVLAEHLNPTSPGWQSANSILDAAGMTDFQKMTMAEQLVNQQAMTLGINDLYMVYALVFIVLSSLVWLARPPFGIKPGGGH